MLKIIIGNINKKAQSELAGFGIIVIIVAILILVFVSFSLNNPSNENIKSYKTESFVQSMIQYTTTCEINGHYTSFLDLPKICNENKICSNGKDSCEVLNSTSKEIVGNSWKVGPDFPVKGYEFSLLYGGKNFVNFKEGNKTGENRGSKQVFSGGLEIEFKGYY